MSDREPYEELVAVLPHSVEVGFDSKGNCYVKSLKIRFGDEGIADGQALVAARSVNAALRAARGEIEMGDGEKVWRDAAYALAEAIMVDGDWRGDDTVVELVARVRAAAAADARRVAT